MSTDHEPIMGQFSENWPLICGQRGALNVHSGNHFVN